MKQLARLFLLLWLFGTAVLLTACTTPTPTAVPTAIRNGPDTAVAATTPAYPAPGYTVIIAPPVAAAYPAPEGSVSSAPLYTYHIVNQYPHDAEAFTQGLVWVDGQLFEGTGRYGQSSLRRVSLETGNVEQMGSLPDNYFGEGIVVWDDKIIQITWQEQTAFVYDRETFDQIGTFTYNTEGWGITHNGRQLIMSDGSNTLFFRDPETFAETGQVQVLDGDTPITYLNELEFINGEVWANVWQTDRIARINPETGQVTGWLDLTGLRPLQTLADSNAVLNGIAYDAVNGRLFITGKLWPVLYEIELIPADS
ncbi:MAG TPA: glutaminyl-peptide cyclotransferase [Chloroflexota bacterium]|nr:glutaminyl-peptide cyclotransferase [Chloroflexota bacterium]